MDQDLAGIPDRVIFGLGNPGPRYALTLHNAGYLVLDRLRAAAGTGWREAASAEQCLAIVGGERVLLARPTTFMNRSGLAASRLLGEHGLEPSALLVVTDDAALPLGRIRIRSGGSPGGHRGLLSISELIGSEEFPRVRLGIGAPPPGEDLAEYVLRPLDGAVLEAFASLVEQGAEAVSAVCRDGLVAAMNRYNPAPPTGNEAGGATAG